MQCFLFLLLVIKIVTFLLRVKKAMITVQTRDIIKIDIRLIRITLNDGHKEREREQLYNNDKDHIVNHR